MHMTSELSFDEIISNLVITQIREFNGEYTILGTIKEDKALLFVKSISFTPEDIVKVLKNHTELNVILKNDVYSTFNISANGTYFLRMIYPADNEKVKKYTGRIRKYIKETKDMYDTKLNAEKQIMGQKNNWIRNIIEKGKELSTEKIFYSDNEIMIITNYKWDGKNVSNMYLLVLFKDEALYSIREVRDVKLLKRVKRVVSDVVKKEYGLGDEEVYCFFHYPPTYYVLHLHVVNANHYGNFCLIGKAILLDEAIENIEKDEDYYNKKGIWCFEY